MSDHSSATLVLYEIPPEQEAALRAAVEASDEVPTDWPEEGDRLSVGYAYYVEECGLDANDTLAGAIIEAAPGVAFSVHVDPKYEYPGVITAYTPELGSFDGSCDSDGNPYVTLGEIERLPDVGQLDGADPLSAALARILGRAWFARFDELRAANEVAENACPSCGHDVRRVVDGRCPDCEDAAQLGQLAPCAMVAANA